MGSLLLSPGSYVQGFACALQESVSPVLGSSVIKSHWPSQSNSLGVLSPLPDPQLGKSVVGPRTFAAVQELLWYNCSPFCGLSAGWLYGGAHKQHLPGLWQSEPQSPRQTTADLCLHGRHSKTQRWVWLSLLWDPWVPVHMRFCLSPLSISGRYGV